MKSLCLVIVMTGIFVISGGCRSKKSINAAGGKQTAAQGSGENGVVPGSDSYAPAPARLAGGANLSLADAAKPLPTGALPVEGGKYYLMPIPKQGNTGDNTPVEFTHQYFNMGDQSASPYFANKNGTSYTIGKGIMETESNRAEATVSEPRHNLKWDPVSKSYSGTEQTWDGKANTWNTTPNFTVFTGGGTQPWKFQPNAEEWRRQSGAKMEGNPDLFSNGLFAGGANGGVASLKQPPFMQYSGPGSIIQQLQQPGFAAGSGNPTVYNKQNYPTGNQYQYVHTNTAFENLLTFILQPNNKPN